MTQLAGLRWLVREMARRCEEPEEEIERAFLELIERGHLRVLPGDGPNGQDGMEMLIEVRGLPERFWLQ